MREVRLLTIVLSALALVACPLPFQFTPEDASRVAASNDPANPSVTASPQLLIREQTTGSAVDAAPAAITARRNIEIRFESETPGASIFYTTDGSRPIPGQGTTVGFDSDSPLEYVGDGAGATIKAIAIGPSMYPSQVTERVVSVDYPTAAAPVFNPAPGAYQSDQTVTLTSSTPGATIYYTTAPGTGGAPVPVPGQPATQEYTGPITVSGTGTSTSISAIAVAPETKTSAVNSGVYSIGFAGNAEAPLFSLENGFQPDGAELTLSSTSANVAIYYTYTTDGSEPPDPSPNGDGVLIYNEPITLLHGGVQGLQRPYRFKAIASGSDLLPSSIVTAEFLVGFTGDAQAPAFSLLDGFHPDATDLALATATAGATVYYTFTTNGTEPPDPVPGADGTSEYTGPEQLRHGGAPDFRQTYRFKAIAAGGTLRPSGVVSAVYDVIPEITLTRTDDDYPQWGVPRTLREAVMAAGNPSGWWLQSPPVWAQDADVIMITLDPSLSGGNPYTINLVDNNPDSGILIERSVVIAGRPGDPDHVTISAGNGFRPFSIGDPQNPNLFVQFQDVTIADGRARGGDGNNGPANGSGGGGGAGVGGAMYVNHGAEVVLERVVMRDNVAMGGGGGNAGPVGQGFYANGASGGRGVGFDNDPTSSGNGGSAGVAGGAGGGPGGGGGWLGGGGAGGSDATNPGVGGNGGFGGGGGGGGAFLTGFTPGAPGGTGGQFGGGGAQGVLAVSGVSSAAGGGGGAGLGGAVFVENGMLIVRASEFLGNAAFGGTAGDTPSAYLGREAGHGRGQGGAIFVYSQGQYQDGGGNAFQNNEARDGSGSANGVTTVYEM